MIIAQPEWLWALLFIPIIYLLFTRELISKKKKFSKFANPAVWETIVPEIDWKYRRRKIFVWSLAFVFIILSLTRPQWGAQEERVKITGLDIMIALDVSNSMGVEDAIPDRLKKAKHLIKNLINRLKGDRVGIVAFAGSSFLAAPLTLDMNYISDVLDTLDTHSVVNQGTDIGLALETANNALIRAAEDMSDSPAEENSSNNGDLPPSKVILLISDGEDFEGKALETLEKLKENGSNIYIMGIGTEKGGPIPIRDRNGLLRGYKKDSNRQGIVSRFNPADLINLADVANGKYWSVSADEGEIEDFLLEIGALERTGISERVYLVYQEKYQLPLGIAVLLLLLELFMPVRNRAKERLFIKPALYFLFFSFSFLCAGSLNFAQAEGIRSYQRNEEGLESYEKGKLDDALKSFGEAQVLEPRNPAIMFNQGTAAYRGGNTDEAANYFRRSEIHSRKSKNADMAARAQYNLGAALEKGGNLKESIQALLGAIDSSKEAANLQLEEDSRRRLEKVVKELQKQRKSKKNGKGDPKKSSKEQKDGKGGEGDPTKEEGEEKDKNRRVGHKRKYDSKSLSKEDAERIMKELSGQEKKIQAKIRKQKGKKAPESGGKDW